MFGLRFKTISPTAGVSPLINAKLPVSPTLTSSAFTHVDTNKLPLVSRVRPNRLLQQTAMALTAGTLLAGCDVSTLDASAPMIAMGVGALLVTGATTWWIRNAVQLYREMSQASQRREFLTDVDAHFAFLLSRFQIEDKSPSGERCEQNLEYIRDAYKNVVTQVENQRSELAQDLWNQFEDLFSFAQSFDVALTKPSSIIDTGEWQKLFATLDANKESFNSDDLADIAERRAQVFELIEEFRNHTERKTELTANINDDLPQYEAKVREHFQTARTKVAKAESKYEARQKLHRTSNLSHNALIERSKALNAVASDFVIESEKTFRNIGLRLQSTATVEWPETDTSPPLPREKIADTQTSATTQQVAQKIREGGES